MTIKSASIKKLALAAGIALALSACGGADAQSTPASPTTTELPVVSSLDDVRAGVVRIEVEGTFEYPSGTSYNEAGSGSGFLISEDGLIVTNNHVVAGAALIKVHMHGEDKPLNARIVGTSECADLAVIEVSTTEAPHLQWTEESLSAGQEIFIAGFPLGDPEYTLIDGIISKEDASGDTSWASIDAVIEHSGDTLPGSSGGPIVGPDGAVYGVNYAGDDHGQAFGISAELAHQVVDSIVDGGEALSIGVNGSAYQDEFGTGVWVSSVVPDSPAGQMGLEAGDLITRLGGLIIAEDGTLSTYCDILATHLPDRAFDVEVWRGSAGAYLEGVINSAETLAIVDSGTSVEVGVSETQDSGTSDLPTGDAYDSYDLVWGAEDEVSLELPSSWNDITYGVWEDYGKVIGNTVSASPNLQGWATTWQTPGVMVGVSDTLTGEGIDPDQFLSDLQMESCEFAENVAYDDGFYAGAYNIWVDCGDTGTVFLDWAAVDSTGVYLISAQFVLVSEADMEAAGHALETLFLTSDLSG